ncbi:MAG: quinoprotein glucose dehydrogenase [Sphingomonas bacterium]|nr:PQQ-binding-like beta-propeller repeat protein [Sphingomonas bacterium]MDB5688192.1 quinoprotein glucose dehydrogenase [Sphingomonas bacterium]
MIRPPLGIVVALVAASAGAAPPIGEWRDYAGDKGAQRYSPLNQITAANVVSLQIAWRRPGLPAELAALDKSARTTGYFKSTPLMVGGRLYAQDAAGLIEAFAPDTGATLWIQERFAGDTIKGSGMRGIAYVEVGGKGRLLAVRDNWLYAVDLEGRIVRSFGDDGRVDLRPGMGPRAQTFEWGGSPQVCGDVVALGATMTDVPANKEEPRGVVQAFDVRTGKARWTFSPIPDGTDPAAKTWENESWKYSGEGNVWPPMSSDEQLRLFFLPTSSATNDMYGGHRLGDNLYTDSVVAVRCDSGRIAWHQQLVHHDLWDLDLNAAPMLVDIRQGGRQVKAAVQLTKRGSVFAFERATGKPIWPIEERPVPQATTPGERTSPTQPFPSKPAPYEPQTSGPDNVLDFTSELRAAALDITKDYVTGPIFTPPAVENVDGKRGSIQMTNGGSGWPGGSFDPDTGMLFIPSYSRVAWISIIPGEPSKTNLRYQKGRRTLIEGPHGLPLSKPPYGRITGIDLTSGDTRWMTANADGPRDHPAIKHLGLPRLGVPSHDMPLATKTLLFVGQADPVTIQGRTIDGKIPLEAWFDDSLRAYDKATGAVIASIKLPAGVTGSMMTYMYNGKQYVVVPIGSMRKPAEFVALALP